MRDERYNVRVFRVWIPAEAAAVRQKRSKVVTREQVHSRPFSERAGVFCICRIYEKPRWRIPFRPVQIFENESQRRKSKDEDL